MVCSSLLILLYGSFACDNLCFPNVRLLYCTMRLVIFKQACVQLDAATTSDVNLELLIWESSQFAVLMLLKLCSARVLLWLKRARGKMAISQNIIFPKFSCTNVIAYCKNCVNFLTEYQDLKKYRVYDFCKLPHCPRHCRRRLAELQKSFWLICD